MLNVPSCHDNFPVFKKLHSYMLKAHACLSGASCAPWNSERESCFKRFTVSIAHPFSIPSCVLVSFASFVNSSDNQWQCRIDMHRSKSINWDKTNNTCQWHVRGLVPIWPAVSTARRTKLRWDLRVENRRAPLFDATASRTTSWCHVQFVQWFNWYEIIMTSWHYLCPNSE